MLRWFDRRVEENPMLIVWLLIGTLWLCMGIALVAGWLRLG